MRQLILGTLMSIICILPAIAQTEKPTAPSIDSKPTSLEQEFKRLIQERLDGKHREDKVFTERTTAETRVIIDEKGDIHQRKRAEILATLGKPLNAGTPAEVKLTVSIEKVRVQRYGETAVVQYRKDMRLILNQEPVLKRFRCSEVYVLKAGAWQSVAYQETVIPGEIVAAKVDATIYDGYVGRYQLFPGYMYTISRSGDKLMFNSREAGDRELMPESETTFVEKGLLYRVIFVRNDRGEVTHLRLREFPGVEYNAIKVK